MQVNLTEFSKDVPAYLKMVSTGKEMFIISQGKVIARVSPPPDTKILRKKSLRGCLQQYAKPELIDKEEDAWQFKESYVQAGYIPRYCKTCFGKGRLENHP